MSQKLFHFSFMLSEPSSYLFLSFLTTSQTFSLDSSFQTSSGFSCIPIVRLKRYQNTIAIDLTQIDLYDLYLLRLYCDLIAVWLRSFDGKHPFIYLTLNIFLLGYSRAVLYVQFNIGRPFKRELSLLFQTHYFCV